MPTDVQLYEAWSQGDQKAGMDLFERYYDRLWLFFSGRVQTDIEDLVQETLLECLRSHERLRNSTSFRAFLFAVARNRLLVRWRKEGRRERAFDQYGAKPPTPPASPITLLGERSRGDQLATALQQLPPELALTLELYYWEGLTYAELSYVLDIGREAVKSRLQRAKAQIKSELCGVAGEPKSMNLDDWAQSMREALSTTRAIRLDGCRTDGES